MPAFTFEKISPPVRHGTTATAPQKPRGVISQVIDRLADKRAKAEAREPRAAEKPTE